MGILEQWLFDCPELSIGQAFRGITNLIQGQDSGESAIAGLSQTRQFEAESPCSSSSLARAVVPLFPCPLVPCLSWGEGEGMDLGLHWEHGPLYDSAPDLAVDAGGTAPPYSPVL